SANNRVGGVLAIQHNVISGNDQNGVDIDAASTGNIVANNYIGLNAAGTGALGNGTIDQFGDLIGDGVLVLGGDNEIGEANAGNVISGNGVGVGISGAAASGTTLLGNTIGLNGAASARIPN